LCNHRNRIFISTCIFSISYAHLNVLFLYCQDPTLNMVLFLVDKILAQSCFGDAFNLISEHKLPVLSFPHPFIPEN
jgi:hypothetical protein